MIDHASIIRDVIERNKKTFIQTSVDFNKVSKKTSVVNEVVLSTQERLALQRKVVLSDIKLCCLEDVKSTLPYLLPHQHEDVVKAEKWLWQLGNKGMLFTNGTGSGKALCLETPIITDKGWVKIKDIKVGDKLFGSNGKPCNVIGVFPQGELEMYRMTFSDGTSSDCCEDHLWEVEDIKDRQSFAWSKKQKRRPQVLSTKEIISRGLRISSYNRINFNIPIIKAVEFSEKSFLIHPYLLGVLLGDGGITTTVTLSNPEDYIIKKISDILPSEVSIKSPKSRSDIEYSISTKKGQLNPILDELRKLNLMGCKSNSKFIPKEYLLGSIEQRINLLNGLLDTDGYVGNKGFMTCYYSVSTQLRDNVRELVESLGGTTSICVKKSPKFTHNNEVRYGQDCYIVYIKMPPHINPFSLPRKRDLVVPKTKYTPVRYITSIEPIGKKQAQCIAVDSEDKLFAINNYILTHNTIMTGGIVYRHQGNNLIVVPSSKKTLDWQEELKLLGLKVYILEGITDKGRKGINITTYANFRQNTSLQQRRWNIVIYDECHNIMSNEQGKETFCLQAHRKTTHHHTFIRENAETLIVGRRPTKEAEIYEYNKEVNIRHKEINEEVERLKVLTKVVFLSATPFPYIENLEYADGYLFDMGSDVRIEDLPSDKDMFYMDNFGYRFEKSKLIKPETGVDVNLLERTFADNLMSSGAMSTRKIQLEYDYSREFILI